MAAVLETKQGSAAVDAEPPRAAFALIPRAGPWRIVCHFDQTAASEDDHAWKFEVFYVGQPLEEVRVLAAVDKSLGMEGDARDALRKLRAGRCIRG